MEEKAIRGIPWTFLTLAGSRLVQIGAMVVLARLLVPSDFGLVAIALTISIFLGLVASLGLGGVFVVEQDLDDRAKGTYLTLFLVMAAGSRRGDGRGRAGLREHLRRPAARRHRPRHVRDGLLQRRAQLVLRGADAAGARVPQPLRRTDGAGGHLQRDRHRARRARRRRLEPRHRPDRGRRRLRDRAPHAGAVPRPAGLRPGRGGARRPGGPRLPRPDRDAASPRRTSTSSSSAGCSAPPASASTPWPSGSRSCRAG